MMIIQMTVRRLQNLTLVQDYTNQLWRESSDTANGFYIGVRFRGHEYGS
jgi:hypothetical protein